MSHIFEILVSPGFSHPCISPLAPIWNGARVSVFFGSVDTLFLCLLPCCLYSVLDGHSYPQGEGFWSSMSLGFSYGHSFQSSGPEDGFMKGISWEKKEQMKSLQGNPHNHRVGEFSICLKRAQSSELKAYRNRAIEYWWGPVREDSRHWLLSPSAKVQRLADHVGSLISGFKKRKIKINVKWWILYIQFEDWTLIFTRLMLAPHSFPIFYSYHH